MEKDMTKEQKHEAKKAYLRAYVATKKNDPTYQEKRRDAQLRYQNKLKDIKINKNEIEKFKLETEKIRLKAIEQEQRERLIKSSIPTVGFCRECGKYSHELSGAYNKGIDLSKSFLLHLQNWRGYELYHHAYDSIDELNLGKLKAKEYIDNITILDDLRAEESDLIDALECVRTKIESITKNIDS